MGRGGKEERPSILVDKQDYSPEKCKRRRERAWKNLEQVLDIQAGYAYEGIHWGLGCFYFYLTYAKASGYY